MPEKQRVVSMRAVTAQMRVAGVSSDVIEQVHNKLTGVVKVPSLPQDVSFRLRKIAAREGRSVLTFNHRTKNWMAYTYEGYMVKVKHGETIGHRPRNGGGQA